uniref:Putative immobilization antigen isoform n=1 Tax=Ichthyophthirius multifiliis TaxID=5932 RepID=A0A7G7YAI0_ICHMU|nr:putative immobilization antigen isoform [Ichthyophthirius multifiliis]
MKYNILIILIISLFINQLQAINCPAGTQDVNGSDNVGAVANCTHCKPNFFYNGSAALGVARGNTPFSPGTDDNTGRCIACQMRLAAPVSTRGQDADLATQCSRSCPAGTVLDDGNTETFQLTATECVKCKLSFFYNGSAALGVARGNTPFSPGTDDNTGRCIACQIPLAAPVSTRGQDADLATQCSRSCPAGTVLDDGNTETFQLTATECVKCKLSFFYNGGAVRGAVRGNTPFAPGVNNNTGQCLACLVPKAAPVSTRGQDADLATQCSIPACPVGTVLADGTTANYAERIAECTNCAADYYSTGAFVAGTSQCTKCLKSKATPSSSAGTNANIATQCDVSCPSGTVLDDGTKSTYAALASECTKCGPNFYTTKNTGFVAGTDSCTECTKKLSSGATAKSFAEATQKVQCAGNFAKFLSISLLFISFYLL